MAKRGKMRKVVTGILATMFVVSLVLAVTGVFAPIAKAEHYCFWKEWCGNDYQWHKCWRCCDAYHCWNVVCYHGAPCGIW